jgi:dTDP-4-dehydrorhamnose reductase
MKILITGGNGNIAQMIRRNLNTKYDIINLSHNDLDILDFKKVKRKQYKSTLWAL